MKAFGWQERYNVAMGVAEAVDFLHNSCAEPVIHRDVKSSNILLSGDFEPQVLLSLSLFNLSANCMKLSMLISFFSYFFSSQILDLLAGHQLHPILPAPTLQEPLGLKFVL